MRRFRFLSHYTSTHPITSTHCESDVRHLTNFRFHVLEWIVHSLASMFPTLHNTPSSLHYVTVLANKRLVTLLSILSSRRNVPNLEPNRFACPHTTEFGFLTNTVAKHMTMPSKANPHSTGSNTTTWAAYSFHSSFDTQWNRCSTEVPFGWCSTDSIMWLRSIIYTYSLTRFIIYHLVSITFIRVAVHRGSEGAT